MFQCQHPSHGPEVTLKDCKGCPDYTPKPAPDAQKLVLANNQSPGDHLVMSAAIYSLHKTYPGKYLTDVEVPCPDVFLHNPWITKLDRDDPEMRVVRMTYNAINESNQRAVHFMAAFCEDLSKALGVPIPLVTNRPQLFFSPEELSWISRVHEVTGEDKRHLIVVCGVKQDYTAKRWVPSYWQELVDRLNDYFRGRVVVVQAGEAHHLHKPLKGVLDQIGKTNTREFIRLCRTADMGIGGVTFAQHIFAALSKPYCCIAGAREPPSFTHFNTQTTLHSIGAVPCAVAGGCWKSRITPLGDGDPKDRELCTNTVQVGGDVVQKCMEIISPEDVFRAVIRHYEGGGLAPLPALTAPIAA